MSHLSAEQLAHLSAELDRGLQKLERSMRVTDEAMKPIELDQSTVGRLSRIDSLQNQGLTRNLQEREQALLGLMVGALRRVDEGRYGTCTDCGEAIPFERLAVFPETPTCARCVL